LQNLFESAVRILVTGGVKSGKSRHAEQLSLALSPDSKPIYLATTEIYDAEMQQRIAEHQQRRADRFQTLEEPLHVERVLPVSRQVVLVECVTMWLNNVLYHGLDEAVAMEKLEALWQTPHDFVFVLNEVGLGVLPENALARRFADLSGRVGQWLGSRCDQVFLCAASIPLQLK
jgi:adenosylcobinamide kinase/adenosylcobinamide-phosphate guanylyltransferase